MMSNTYHYSLCIILLIFKDLKGFHLYAHLTQFSRYDLKRQLRTTAKIQDHDNDE